MRVSELALRAGVNASAVRFYEAIGVLPPASRRENGYRSYGPDDLARLRLVVSLRRLGLGPEDAERAAGRADGHRDHGVRAATDAGVKTRMSSMDVRYTLTFDPVSRGTRMQWVGDVQPKGYLRLITPLVGWMGRRQELRIWTSLKGLLERPDAPAAN